MEEDQNMNNITVEIKKSDLIRDIIASDPISEPTNKKQKRFYKKTYEHEESFSIVNLNLYLDWKFYYLPNTVKALLEILLVGSAFMFFPILCLLIEYKSNAFNVLLSIFDLDPKDNLIFFIKTYVFISTAYAIYVIVTLVSDNILYLSVSFLGFFKITVDEIVVQILQVTKYTSTYWKWALICYLVFYSYSRFIAPYDFLSQKWSITHFILTLLLWYTCLMVIISFEKFFLNFCTAEIRRKEYRNRIWDINYRIFVFQKLLDLSKTQQPLRSELAESMQPEFDPGFYIKYGSLKLDSTENCKSLAESILAYLEVSELDINILKDLFPDNHSEIYEFLSGKKIKPGEELEPISYEKLEEEITKLYNDRTVMSRTLSDRDIIFNKLDYCLYIIGFYASLIILCTLLNFDYKVYLASLGPAFFVFGLVFADALKEIYYSFIFLLVKHPYDIGDRVVIEGCEYIVEELNLFSSIFIDINGRVVYMANSRLFPLKIYNIRRSGNQYDEIEIKISKTTTYGKGLEILHNLRDELKQKNDFFTGSVILRSFISKDDSVLVKYAIEHSSNFQDDEAKYKRREELTKILEKILLFNKIQYSNSFDFKELV